MASHCGPLIPRERRFKHVPAPGVQNEAGASSVMRGGSSRLLSARPSVDMPPCKSRVKICLHFFFNRSVASLSYSQDRRS